MRNQSRPFSSIAGMRAFAFAIVAAVCACAAPVEAQEPSNPIDSAAVARFADEFFPREMPRRRIPGLVFVFVSWGEITVARGYGAAELASQRRVDPDRTRFRLASVSKPIPPLPHSSLWRTGDSTCTGV